MPRMSCMHPGIVHGSAGPQLGCGAQQAVKNRPPCIATMALLPQRARADPPDAARHRARTLMRTRASSAASRLRRLPRAATSPSRRVQPGRCLPPSLAPSAGPRFLRPGTGRVEQGCAAWAAAPGSLALTRLRRRHGGSLGRAGGHSGGLRRGRGGVRAAHGLATPGRRGRPHRGAGHRQTCRRAVVSARGRLPGC